MKAALILLILFALVAWRVVSVGKHAIEAPLNRAALIAGAK